MTIEDLKKELLSLEDEIRVACSKYIDKRMVTYAINNKGYTQEEFNKEYQRAIEGVLSAFIGTTLFKQG